jgi:hypothetical protein
MAALPDIPEMTERELLIEVHAAVRSINTAVLLHRRLLLGNGEVGLVEDVRNITALVGEIVLRLKAVETTLTGEGQEVGLVAEHQSARKDLDRVVSFGKWIGGAITILVSGLLWAIFTGKVSLVFH